jgi:two-component system response regulator HydG
MVQRQIDLIADTDMSVIISGESGTGKEYVAKSIHNKSKRADLPFIAIDCGALPRELAASELFGHLKGAFTGAVSEKKGCFELANGGTLFLDEIGNLGNENQLKLLRVLQEEVIKKVGGTTTIPVDVRLLIATNENLMESIKEGSFREDLYYRLDEFRIQLAPLRERREDILLFARHFLRLANQELKKGIRGFEEVVVQKLLSYSWPGNLRELRNVIKRSVLLCTMDRLNVDCLPPEIINVQESKDILLEALRSGDANEVNLKTVAEQAERKAILKVLKETNFNKTRTAQLLKVSRKTLYNKLRA